MASLKTGLPSKIIAVGLNYRSHAAELGMPVPDEPVLFMKPPSSVIGDGDAIVMPPQSTRVDYEAELAVVIAAATRNVSPGEATSRILGYTCANDVTARDLQEKDGQWIRSKGFDTFCPLGPQVVPELPGPETEVELLLNGEVRQRGLVSDMIFTPEELVSFISHIMTLKTGDVILTGTPPGVGPLSPGDEATVRISGIGSLSNPVKSQKS